MTTETKWIHHPDRRGAGEYRLNVGPCEVIVHEWIHDPGKWFVSCHRIGIDKRPLASAAPGNACEEAHRFCIAWVTRIEMMLVAGDPKKLADEIRNGVR